MVTHNQLVTLPHSPQPTRPIVTQPTINSSSCHKAHSQLVPLLHSPQPTRPVATQPTANSSRCHTAHRQLFPLPHSPQPTRPVATQPTAKSAHQHFKSYPPKHTVYSISLTKVYVNETRIKICILTYLNSSLVNCKRQITLLKCQNDGSPF